MWLKGGLQAKVNGLREVQSAGGEELSALMVSVLDRALRESCVDADFFVYYITMTLEDLYERIIWRYC